MKQPEDYYTIDMFEDDRKMVHLEHIEKLRTRVIEDIQDGRSKAVDLKIKKDKLASNIAVKIVHD